MKHLNIFLCGVDDNNNRCYDVINSNKFDPSVGYSTIDYIASFTYIIHNGAGFVDLNMGSLTNSELVIVGKLAADLEHLKCKYA